MAAMPLHQSKRLVFHADLPPGAEAFKRDIRNAEVRFYDTGHFALETHHREIAGAIRDFLGRQVAAKATTA